MPVTAADTGQGTIRELSGTCDLCGQECHPNDELCASLACTYTPCPESAMMYHQGCLEKYLKTMKFEA